MRVRGYSQNNEDIVIQDYFGSYKGTFLDLGANDGMILSNTYGLAMMGWFGVSVEASKKAFDQLKGNYKKLKKVSLYNLAVTADKEGEITFYESGTHLNKGDVSLLSTTHANELKRWEGSRNEFSETKAIAMLFEKFYESQKHKIFDFISVDIEGEDLNVLMKMDLTAMGTRLICLEHNSVKAVKNNMIRFCDAHDMTKILLDNAENIIISR